MDPAPEPLNDEPKSLAVRSQRHPWSVAFVFAILLVSHCYFLNEYPRFHHPNTYSRLYLTLAIAEQGTFRVDEQVQRYGRVQDLAKYEGHYFSDKAPGASFLLAPLAWVLRHTFIPLTEDATNMIVALRLLGVSIPTVLFWFLTRRFWYDLAGGAPRGLAVILAGSQSTSFFIYATQLFSHVPASILAFCAFLLIRRSFTASGRRSVAGLCLGAGFCTAAAFVVDYVMLLVVPVLFAFSIMRGSGRWSRLAAMALGAFPVALAAAAYNYECFDSPLVTGFYHHHDPVYREAYRSGMHGIQAPDWAGLPGITILPERGVLYLAPVLLLAPIGWWRQLRRRDSRNESITAILVTVALGFFALTTVDWTSGYSVGCRYLVPAIPFMLTGVASALRGTSAHSAVGIAFRAAVPVGFVTIGLSAATFPCFPKEFDNPVWQLALPMAQYGVLTQNLAGAMGHLDDLLPFALLAAAAIAFVVWRPWPNVEKRNIVAAAAAIVLAAGLLACMQRSASPADTQTHDQVRRGILHIMGR